MTSKSGKSEGDRVCIGVIAGPHGVRGWYGSRALPRTPRPLPITAQ